MSSDLFSAPAPAAPARSNVPELSVSELSGSVQRTLEESFGRVRVRGEIAGMKLAASGHLYADLKDENANINMICWRTTVQRLKIKPEDGLEVICTGKITTYPKSSRYQLIVESIELAGAGALLKMLEDRKKRLAAEGLFDPARKVALPYLPRVIGVVTSPTGAVIRDILHRLNDRFPRHVLVWPVMVQGEGAAEQIAAAIRGFAMLPADGSTPRPDLIIVARGGGSLEDLMAFNEEAVVRAAADCTIPLISAVGHETDTTLIDFAADVRAPTPTAAAEMAVPVRAELLATVMDSARRLFTGMIRLVDHRRERVQAIAARLGDPQRLLAIKAQGLDHLSHKLDSAFDKGNKVRETRVVRLGAALRHPRSLIERESQRLQDRVERLKNTAPRLLSDKAQALNGLVRMLESLSFERVLDRGYVVVRDPVSDRPFGESAEMAPGQAVTLQFKAGQRRRAVVD
ncbi:MAG: exodeoxyribonuclease VII large subunit [Alphaproteobacteria bacterium]|nr:exodeoxyribonuclease VII large subunit [Alphaproteobacteria bacterium]